MLKSVLRTILENLHMCSAFMKFFNVNHKIFLPGKRSLKMMKPELNSIKTRNSCLDHIGFSDWKGNGVSK